MSPISVDREKCGRDGICVAECPLGIIEMKNPFSSPTPVAGAEGMCIRCGHCVAVCPHGAISLDGMRPEQCPPLRKELALSTEHVEHFLRSRRSIRTYLAKEVEAGKLAALIDVARYAPTGSNSQQVKWLVVNSRAGVEKVAAMIIDLARYLIGKGDPIAEKYRFGRIVAAWEAGIDVITRGAPALVFAHAPKEYMAAQTDSAIALTFLDLAAPSFGLGTCWAGFVMIAAGQWPPLAQALALPDGNACFGAMMVGYPKYQYQRLPLRNKADIVWR